MHVDLDLLTSLQISDHPGRVWPVSHGAVPMDDFEILLKYREAQRDKAYAEHGAEWRKHVPNPGQFWSAEPIDAAERAHLVAVRTGKLN